MHKVRIQIFLILIFLTVFGATAARSQETQTTNSVETSVRTAVAPNGENTTNARQDEICEQRLLKTLDAFEKLTKAKANVDAELLTKDQLLAKESAYNQELLKAVALLTSSEKRDKSFFRKLLDQLGKVLKAATKPENLVTIAGMIVIIKNLK